jgi:16S rRNA C967 or C1407 C5-methylase (RsmB/RsmF family)/NOL1/NOP2/fmu family ribosome biogenesis protein
MENKMLPEAFCQRVKNQLGPEGWAAFAACQRQVPWGGLRLNTLKGKPKELLKLLDFPLEPVPWARDGYYYPIEYRPAKLPFYQAGLYYLQEPSAMSSAALLDVQPGDYVLDLCAAPGGKSTQLAAALQGQGLLVSNDNSPKRVKALVWNLEHWGVTNYLVLQEEPAHMANAFKGFFDKILVDAPCSGEGMFRKDPKAVSGWQAYNGEVCRRMQDDILQAAAGMLRPGGRLLYSTCTFNPLENEETIKAFMQGHSDFELINLPMYEGWLAGSCLPETRQLWPHLVRGEGHFVALLQKKEEAALVTASKTASAAALAAAPSLVGQLSHKLVGKEGLGKKVLADKKSQYDYKLQPDKWLEPLYKFMAENLTEPLPGPFALFQNHVYQVQGDIPDLAGLKVAKPGWYLGMIKGNHFEPSQAMAMGLKASQFKRCLHLDPADPLVDRYLKGETLMIEGEKGWTLVTIAGYPLGFGKQTEDFMKNSYPPGWRIT